MSKRLKTLYIKINDNELIQVKQNKVRAEIANIAEKYNKLLNKYKRVLVNKSKSDN